MGLAIIFLLLTIILFHCVTAVRQRERAAWYLLFGTVCWIIYILVIFGHYYGIIWQYNGAWVFSTLFVAAQILYITDKYLQGWLLETQIVAAKNELNYLRSQISQHFIHNTLESISALVDIEPQEAQALLHKFSDYLRFYYAFDDEKELVTLREEMRLVETYLSIETTRIGERLRQKIDIQPECLDMLLPPLSIQPLAENAIKHGIFPRRSGGVLRIAAQMRENKLVITVADDGVGADVDSVEALTSFRSSGSTGVGLKNVVQRLRRAGAVVRACGRKNEGVRITIELPENSENGGKRDAGHNSR